MAEIEIEMSPIPIIATNKEPQKYELNLHAKGGYSEILFLLNQLKTCSESVKGEKYEL